jgi:hypothetical protein
VADPNLTNGIGMTPVLQASRYGDVPIVRTLLVHGADVEHSVRDGETPLMAAARSGNHDAVQLLLERGSVSERLQGVSYGRELSTTPRDGRTVPDAGDQKIVTALFARLIEDPSVNVRLAALEALRPIATQENRRGQLVAAVSRQDSPLVALSLIDLLLESGTAAARHDLEQLLANDQLDPVVRGYLRDRLGRRI